MQPHKGYFIDGQCDAGASV